MSEYEEYCRWRIELLRKSLRAAYFAIGFACGALLAIACSIAF